MMRKRKRQADLRPLPLIVVAGLMLAGPAQADMTSTPLVDSAVVPPLKYEVVSDIATQEAAENEAAAPAEAVPEDAPALSDPALSDDVAELLGQGEASYYGHELAGNRTASGERFDPGGLTAAHRTLPLGSKLRITNLSNGESVIVRINDRGPFIKRRVIDVSLAAARKINMVRAGKAMVKLELLR